MAEPVAVETDRRRQYPMNSKQRKLRQYWFVVGILIVTLVIFHDADWSAWLAFLPALLYVMLNWKDIDEFQRRSPKPMEIIQRSTGIRYWVLGSSAFLISAASASLLSGLNPLDHLGFASLLLLIFLPLFPVVYQSQVTLYRDLASDIRREHAN